MKKSLFVLAVLTQSVSWAQAPEETIKKIVESKKLLERESLFKSVDFKNIGPTIMSGRVVDLDVNPENTAEFYVAYASGGLWYTSNNGTSFNPVMDTAPTLNCGSVAVDWKTGTLWVGTGEINASRSSYAGVGILKSTDKGKTWENMGLPDSHHISKILINPANVNEVVVGVVGHLYTKNKERGVFKTTDGGKTWKQTLFINDQTGVIDMAVVPDNFNVLYAASWQKDRKAYNFNGNGVGSGMYKSTDGGSSWQLISTKDSGFPSDQNVGRIGVTAFSSDVLYAVVDNQNKRPLVKIDSPKGSKSTHSEAEVIGAEIYKSIDAGKTWKRTHDNFVDDFFSSYGYYFGDITVDPKNADRIYITGIPLLFSGDGGKCFESISGRNVHSDHHVVWVDPKNPNHIINGNDGGVNVTYDNGKSWIKCNSHAVGQFYSVNVDEQEPYNIYGGLQDNGVWVGPNDYENNAAWQQNGEYSYKELSGGDGMQVQVDNRNPNIVFTGSQYGSYSRIDREKNTDKSITPKNKKGDEPFRFNWQTPILLSSHNQDILYFGSNFLHRSMNQGDSWEAISGDLTNGKKEGNVVYGTLTTISESPFQFGLLYTGSDDGLIQVSKDGGNSWNVVSGNLPQNLWVSRVIASSHKKQRVYASLNGYRNDDFSSYVYVSDDYGVTWKNIAGNLPLSPVNVIKEDNVNENILYVGSDNGLYISLDRGLTLQDFSVGMPDVAVHDLVIQKKSKDLIVGTHGRSLYKTSIAQVQQLDDKIRSKNLYLFDTDKIKKSDRWGFKWNSWGEAFEPETTFWFYTGSETEVDFSIFNEDKAVVFSKKIKAVKGLNKLSYDLSMDKVMAEKWKARSKEEKMKLAPNGKYYLPISKYKIEISQGQDKQIGSLEVVK